MKSLLFTLVVLSGLGLQAGCLTGAQSRYITVVPPARFQNFSHINKSVIQKCLGVDSLLKTPAVRKVIVYIFDKKFGPGSHGLYMTRILQAVTDDAVEIYQSTITTYPEFKKSVEEVIQASQMHQDTPHLILNSQVWNFGVGENGLWAPIVRQATSAGIGWINAAGNFQNQVVQGRVHDLSVTTTATSGRFFPFTCQNQSCPIEVVLSWNSLSKKLDDGVFQNLDFIVRTVPQKNVMTGQMESMVVAQSSQQQKLKRDWDAKNGLHSLIPKEIWKGQVPAGQYVIEVVPSSQGWDQDSRYTLVLEGSAFDLPSTDPRMALAVLPPADLPEVLTVGALDSFASSTSYAIGKPDIRAESWIPKKVLSTSVSFSHSSLQQTEFYPAGSSSAAALVSGVIADKLSRQMQWNRGQKIDKSILGN